MLDILKSRAIRILHHGKFSFGGNDYQRHRALCCQQDTICAGYSEVHQTAKSAFSSAHARLRWRIGWPIDEWGENEHILTAARQFMPDIILVENSKVLTLKTIQQLRLIGDPVLAFISSDDMMARHNLSKTLRKSLRDWDIIFTTKAINVEELRLVGARNPFLMTNMFDPLDHYPLSAAQVGLEFEKFDLSFIGTFEGHRARSLNNLAEEGFSVLVHGNPAGMMSGDWVAKMHPAITVRPAVFGPDYSQAMHHSKVSLCFLRKMNRDRITTRSMEIPAARRCMLAEKTLEHDAHFVDRREYVSFTSDQQLVDAARFLVDKPDYRAAIAMAGYDRCLKSGYNVARAADVIVRECLRFKTLKKKSLLSPSDYCIGITQ